MKNDYPLICPNCFNEKQASLSVHGELFLKVKCTECTEFSDITHRKKAYCIWQENQITAASGTFVFYLSLLVFGWGALTTVFSFSSAYLFGALGALALVVFGKVLTNYFRGQGQAKAVLDMEGSDLQIGGRLKGVVYGFTSSEKSISMTVTLRHERVHARLNYDKDGSPEYDVAGNHAHTDIIKELFSSATGAVWERDNGMSEGHILIDVPIPEKFKASSKGYEKVRYRWSLLLEPTNTVQMSKQKLEFPILVGVGRDDDSVE